MKFFDKYFFSKCDKIGSSADLVTFTEEILKDSATDICFFKVIVFKVTEFSRSCLKRIINTFELSQ